MTALDQMQSAHNLNGYFLRIDIKKESDDDYNDDAKKPMIFEIESDSVQFDNCIYRVCYLNNITDSIA